MSLLMRAVVVGVVVVAGRGVMCGARVILVGVLMTVVLHPGVLRSRHHGRLVLRRVSHHIWNIVTGINTVVVLFGALVYQQHNNSHNHNYNNA
jgi:hypothetical protein